MNVRIECQSNHSTRKRIRERDRSPDMFAPDEDDEDFTSIVLPVMLDKNYNEKGTENYQVSAQQSTKPNQLKRSASYDTQSSIDTKSSPASKSSLLNEHLSPRHRIFATPSGNNKQSFSPSDSKSSNWCSISSLRSTINNFGLNSRMKEVLHSESSSTCEYASISSSSSGKTPAVYTLNSSSVPTQPSLHCGPHYGLSVEVWQAIQQTRGIKGLYEWQDQCLNMALKSNQNLLYSLPTSGGKTLVAEILMIRELLCNRKHCLFVMPYVSIVQEKMRTLSSLAVSLNFAVEEYAGNRGSFPPRKRKSKQVIYIATLEKAHGIINSLLELGRISEIGTFSSCLYYLSILSVNRFIFPYFRIGCCR